MLYVCSPRHQEAEAMTQVQKLETSPGNVVRKKIDE